MEASPEAIAAFLRQHNSSLNKEQLGEYLGHHDELEVRKRGKKNPAPYDKAINQLLSINIHNVLSHHDELEVGNCG